MEEEERGKRHDEYIHIHEYRHGYIIDPTSYHRKEEQLHRTLKVYSLVRQLCSTAQSSIYWRD
jgi:hypothetical protein